MEHTFRPSQRITPNGTRAIQSTKHPPPLDTGRPGRQAQRPLTPSARAQTGPKKTLESQAYSRNTNREQSDPYHSIFLLRLLSPSLTTNGHENSAFWICLLAHLQ
ncbi:MAG: hypothetical protein P8J66_01180 [Verrucomicrobiota bacterium]|nr:hypothetical protein [Verrucomicrobiota bacterium]